MNETLLQFAGRLHPMVLHLPIGVLCAAVTSPGYLRKCQLKEVVKRCQRLAVNVVSAERIVLERRRWSLPSWHLSFSCWSLASSSLDE